jgi:hypothetical protein
VTVTGFAPFLLSLKSFDYYSKKIEVKIRTCVCGVMVSMEAFQAFDPGSIPGKRTLFLFLFFLLFFLSFVIYSCFFSLLFSHPRSCNQSDGTFSLSLVIFSSLDLLVLRWEEDDRTSSTFLLLLITHTSQFSPTLLDVLFVTLGSRVDSQRNSDDSGVSSS